ncbi:MAG: threonylcarbamoyl-AMP synthase [Eubacteriales bacterium]|nr:threonylcarbamoyl-AMP synthase [Eubacteriales bacterium]
MRVQNRKDEPAAYETQIIQTIRQDEAGTTQGAKLIQAGELVAFPTETVYGLGADGLNGEAVAKIFLAKGRPADNPLIEHVAKKSDVRQLWRRIPKQAQVLMDTFWPGPLTLIAPKSDCVPDAVTAGLDTVAVRMPQNKTARSLIQKSGVPIAAPSANRSGRPSPTTAQHVFEDMNGRIPLILDGGPCKYGVESTVLSLAGEPTILRPGAITREMLAAAIGEVGVSKSVLEPMREGETAASPGMKYKHYAPNAEVIVVLGSPEQTAKRINSLIREAEAEGKICEIAATEQTKHFYKGKKHIVLGDRDEPVTLCTKLFSVLRDMDTRADVIFAEGIPAEDEGLAYMNRLLRAAGFHVIDASQA